MCSHLTPLSAFGYTATFGTFNFLVVYLLTCVVAPVELYRAGELSLRNLAAGILGAGLMAFVIIGSVIPVPPFPYNLLPYIFLHTWRLVGFGTACCQCAFSSCAEPDPNGSRNLI
jgi:hypothetical protein